MQAVIKWALGDGRPVKLRCLASVFLLFAAIFLLSGCAPLVDPDQIGADPGFEVLLQAGGTIGQTFVARHSGLNGVEIWLAPAQAGPGDLRLSLMAEPADRNLLASAALPVASITGPGFYRFPLPLLPDSHSRYYYAVLEAEGDAALYVGAASSPSYLDGSMHLNDAPVARQMTFRLTYDRVSIVLDLARFGLQSAALLLAAGLLFLVPGWAVLVVLCKQRLAVSLKHWAEAAGVAFGIGLALYPVLMLWLNVVGLRAGRLLAYLPVLGGLAVLVWRYRPWQIRLSVLRAAVGQWWRSANALPDGALLVVLLLASGSWFLSVRGLEMPFWYDSVQHGVMVQRIVESGGLYTSWDPYTPYRTFSQQFGFHADVAVWAWFTGLATPAAVIWGGQIISLFAVLALYPLAYRIRGPWAGLVAVFVAAVPLVFPVYYTNWGRYPQMAGQALLCIAAWWAWQLWHGEKGWRWGDLLLGAILIVSTALAYYRMAFHFLAFVAAMWLVAANPLKRFAEHKRWLALGLTAAISLVMFAPWLLNLQTALLQSADAAARGGGSASLGIWAQITGMEIGWRAPLALVILVGTVVAVWGGGGALALPVVWLWLLETLLIVRRLPLPGVNIIQDFTIATSLYMPQAWIWAALAGFLLERRRLTARRWFLLPVALLIVAASAWYLPTRLRLIDRAFDLSTRPDLRAAAWIRASVPEDAFFLINGVVYTDGFSANAGDAGAWIPLLTQRGVVIPPQYALLAEQPNEPGYSDAVNGLISQLASVSAATAEGHAAICAFPRPITHVYLGQRQGLVNKALPNKVEQPMLMPDQLLADDAFRLIYHQDQVMIFEFDRSLCASG